MNKSIIVGRRLQASKAYSIVMAVTLIRVVMGPKSF